MKQEFSRHVLKVSQLQYIYVKPVKQHRFKHCEFVLTHSAMTVDLLKYFKLTMDLCGQMYKSNYSWLYQLEIKLLTTRTRYLKMSSTVIGSFKQPRQNDYATEPCGYMYGSDYRHSLDFLSCFLPYVSFTRRPCNQLYDFHYRQLTA